MVGKRESRKERKEVGERKKEGGRMNKTKKGRKEGRKEGMDRVEQKKFSEKSQ